MREEPRWNESGALSTGVLMAREPGDGPLEGPERIDRLVEENLGWLRGWLHGRVRDPGEADDLCQESLLKAVERFPRLRDPEKFPRWLFRIAQNTLRDHIRQEVRRRARVTLTDEFEGIAPAVMAGDPGTAEEAGNLLAEIRALPPRLREPLLLRHSRNLSYREIGRILGLRENTVQVRIFRARRALRKKLRVEGEGTGGSTMTAGGGMP